MELVHGLGGACLPPPLVLYPCGEANHEDSRLRIPMNLVLLFSERMRNTSLLGPAAITKSK